MPAMPSTASATTVTFEQAIEAARQIEAETVSVESKYRLLQELFGRRIDVPTVLSITSDEYEKLFELKRKLSIIIACIDTMPSSLRPIVIDMVRDAFNIINEAKFQL